MPLTSTQVSSTNLLNSVKDWLAANVVTPYNAQVASSQTPATLKIIIAYPDDIDYAVQAPLIAIENPPLDIGEVHGTGVGDGMVWRNKRIYLCCYSAITSSGKPSVVAQDVLQSLIDYAVGTCLYMPIYDYVPSPKVLADCAQVVDPGIVRFKGKFDPIMSLEKNRFDYAFTLRFSQTTIGG